jgi:hypothetical protein
MIFQIELIVRNMILIKILIGGKKRDMKFNSFVLTNLSLLHWN